MHHSRSLVFTLILTIALSLAFTVSADPTEPVTKVVTTTNLIGEIARRLSPNSITVKSLMGEGVDPHQYRASPNDTREMLSADLILYNGLHLEGKLVEVLEGISKRRTVVSVSDGIPRERLRQVGSQADTFDPHIWFDVSLWKEVAKRVAQALSEKSPESKIDIETRLSRYLEELAELETWIRAQVSLLPPAHRTLVTAHDAFEYFGKAYGIEVLSIQGINTTAEVSLKAIEDLVHVIVEKKIPAVFFENSVPKRSVEALIEGCKVGGHTVVLGGELYSDSLGAKTSDAGTYVSMVQHNVKTIVLALGGTITRE